jgi:8-oxo-dGTP pyrophosphatase MutT (NUDIX family)
MLLLDLFETSAEDERQHFDALHKTGFYGAQGAGLIFLAQSTGRFLLAERSTKPPPRNVEQPGTFGVWGGAIDSNEDPKTAAIREAEEECGYNGQIKMIPLFVFRKDTFRYSNFLGVIPDEFTPRLNWESESYKWCEFGNWPKPLHFGVMAILNDPNSVQIMKEFLKI